MVCFYSYVPKFFEFPLLFSLSLINKCFQDFQSKVNYLQGIVERIEQLIYKLKDSDYTI